MNHSFFDRIDPALAAPEQEARAKRQRTAEWGLALTRLGGTHADAAQLQELQRYIDGDLSLEEYTRTNSIR